MNLNENPLELPAMTARVVHGIRHMPARHLALRVVAVVAAASMTVWFASGTNPAAGALVGALLTAGAVAITALELYTAALMCELADDGEDQDDDEFGTAA